jgi:hypothetical protein
LGRLLKQPLGSFPPRYARPILTGGRGKEVGIDDSLQGLGQKEMRILAIFPTKSLDCGSLLPLSAMRPAASGAT